MGISKAHDRAELETAVALAAQFDRKIIVERAIIGRELECAVLGNEAPIASLPCEILPSREFYDYDDKYLLDRAETKLPADLPAETTEKLRRLAVEMLSGRVECEGMGRVDFLLEAATGKLYINEINTIPGFTSISMYPKMWEASGVELCRTGGPFDSTGAGAAGAEKGDQIYSITAAIQSPPSGRTDRMRIAGSAC